MKILLALLLAVNAGWAAYKRDTVGTALSLIGLVLVLS